MALEVSPNSKFIAKSVKKLVPHADLNLTTNESMSVLHLAALTQNCEVVEILVESGCDVNAVNLFGNTALQEALLADEREDALAKTGAVLSKLISSSKINLNNQNKIGKSVAHLMAIKNRALFLDIFIKTGKLDLNLFDNQGKTALVDALQYGSVDAANILAKHMKITDPVLLEYCENQDRKIEEELVKILLKNYQRNNVDLVGLRGKSTSNLSSKSIRTINEFIYASKNFD